MGRRIAVLFLGCLVLASCRGSNPAGQGATPPPAANTEVALERGLNHLATGQNPDGSWGEDYQVAVTSVALTAGGVSSLYLLGPDDLPEIEGGLSFMAGRQHDPAVREKEAGYYCYATYYATLAWSHKGGIAWNDWWGKVSGEVAARQHPDGGWTGPYDPELCASFACLVLSAPKKGLAVWRD